MCVPAIEFLLEKCKFLTLTDQSSPIQFQNACNYTLKIKLLSFLTIYVQVPNEWESRQAFTNKNSHFLHLITMVQNKYELTFSIAPLLLHFLPYIKSISIMHLALLRHTYTYTLAPLIARNSMLFKIFFYQRGIIYQFVSITFFPSLSFFFCIIKPRSNDQLNLHTSEKR